MVAESAETDRESEIESLLGEMTLEEKVGQLNQLNGSDQTGPAVDGVDLEAEIGSGRVGSVLNVDGLENRRRYQRIAVEETRLGIPLLFGFDVVHGFRTIFPIPLGEAATWNPDLAERTADVAGTETAAAGIHWTFAPTVDVSRDARWGRAMESSGEDAYLASKLARARVRGLQGEDLSAVDTVLACAKHFAGYGDVKAGREYNTVDISESSLRDVHLPPFEAAVDEGVATVMNAFTAYDRIPAGADESLVSETLKDDWDFEGFVVSDWNSVRELIYHGVAGDEAEAAETAIEAGSDVDMVGHVFSDSLVGLVEDGTVDESTLDNAVRRVLRYKFELGLFDDPFRYFDDDRKAAATRREAHRSVAREAARESLVLLKNEKDLLPLVDDYDDIAVVGALADSQDDMLGNWRARGQPRDAVTVLEGVRAAVGDGTNVRFVEGCDRSGAVSEKSQREAVEAVDDADVAVVAVGENWELSGECRSRTSIDLPGDQRSLLEALDSTDTDVASVLFNGRPLAVPWMDEHLPAILEAWFPGTQAGHAVADVLFGERDPSGRLPMSFPRNVGQCPVHYDHLPTGRPAETAEPGWATSYMETPNAPLYSFGHGLSYAEFEYDEFALSDDVLERGGVLTVSVRVTNTGDRRGDETVQLYTHDRVGSRSRPVKELAGFETVTLNPDESKTVRLQLTEDDLAFWTADGEMAAEPGEFEVMVGRSAADIRVTGAFELRG
ncbi:beta-glucosidase BglX [Halomicrococcus sp. NG-SE-24]|uniref:beta-glucosidase BglX n=1 Tax=Halomicrococcus sp. NG-SE-24 TaxID=3436928 RepID=UPI003D974103